MALLPHIGIGPKRRLIFRDFDLINDLVHLSGLECMTFHLWVGEATMNVPMIIYSQLLATKFFVPVPSGTLISRPRLTALLDESLKYPLTLISAPSCFAKPMLLSSSFHSLPPNPPLL